MLERERSAVSPNQFHTLRGVLEAQIPGGADLDREVDIRDFLQRTKEQDLGGVEEAPANTAKSDERHALHIDEGAASFDPWREGGHDLHEIIIVCRGPQTWPEAEMQLSIPRG